MFVSKKKYQALEQDCEELDEALYKCRTLLDSYKDTLEYILAQETVAPNATMLRVLNAAKEALEA